jgi:DNA polymerase-3 subunit epsilon
MGWLNWLRNAGPRAPDGGAGGRWVVLDVESTGLHVRRDHLLAVAAVALRLEGPGPDRIVVGDSFDVVLQHDTGSLEPDRPNILLHGIGLGRQRAGMPRREALQAFERWAADAPLIAFHAAFDRAMIDRARGEIGLPPTANPWLDLEPLAGVLRPDIRARSLDEWMAALRIHCVHRHQAAADTLATAELLLRLLPRLRQELRLPAGVPRFATVQRLADQRRWVPG